MKIIVADDHELFLKGLEFVLRDVFSQESFIFVHNYNELFEKIEQNLDTGLVITDLAMPGASWMNGIQKIHQLLPETPIIILSAVFDKDIIHKTIELGAAGYISKTASNQTIIDAIHLVMSGGIYIPSDLLQNTQMDELNSLKLIEESANPRNSLESIELSPRQLDVLKLIGKGLSNKQIAFELGITEGTVKLYVTAILKILNVYNRVSAVNEARKLGLIQDV